MIFPTLRPLSRMAVVQILLLLLQLAFAHPPQKLLSPSALKDAQHGPSVGSASTNANHIFNAIHSSMVSDL